MRRSKLIVFIALLCIVGTVLSGCRNNLVNEWENYTGVSDVYYNEPTETSDFAPTASESATSESTEDVHSVTKYGLPNYWNDELRSVVDDSNRLIRGAGGNCTAFLWYNDAHFSYSSRRSVSVLKYLQDQTNVQIINFGGDIVSTYYEMEESEAVSLIYDWRESTLALSNHHSVVGNHDDDIEDLAEREDLYEFLLSEESNKVSAENNKFCYYVDYSYELTRYIYLATGLEVTTADDLLFLIEALSSAPKDWHIVVVSHIWFSYNDTSTPTEGVVPEFAQVILNVLDDYNARISGHEKEIDYDFASAEAKVEFCIGGHTHVDFDFYTDGGIPVILNETDSYHLRGEGKGIDGTDEACVSVIVADYGEGLIHIIRAGRGESRTVPLANVE